VPFVRVIGKLNFDFFGFADVHNRGNRARSRRREGMRQEHEGRERKKYERQQSVEWFESESHFEISFSWINRVIVWFTR
jgi:hypothetical protein